MPGPHNEAHDTWVVTEEGAVIDFVGTSPPDAVQTLAEIGAQLESVHREIDLRVAESIDMVEAADWRGKDLVSELNAMPVSIGQCQSGNNILWPDIAEVRSDLRNARLSCPQRRAPLEADYRLPTFQT